jgi:hypothetical protein
MYNNHKKINKEVIKAATSFKGAGILLYDYVGDSLVFLLGKENSPDDPAREKYCEFGGNAKKDEDPLSTALRELREEGMGFIDPKIVEKYFTSNGKEERSKEVPIIESYVSLEQPNCYYTFLIKYDYSEEVVEKFNTHFNETSSKTKLDLMPLGLFEKSCIRWWTLDEILNGRYDKTHNKVIDQGSHNKVIDHIRIKPYTEILFHHHLVKILEKRWPEECRKLKGP